MEEEEEESELYIFLEEKKVQVGAGAAMPVIPSMVSTGPQEQKRFISP